MIRKVLIATDFSERSARAEVRAAMLSRELGSDSAVLCNVMEPGVASALAHVSDLSEPEAEKILNDQATQELARRACEIEKDHGLRCATRLRFGFPAQELALQAEEMDADLIVVGAHGQSFISRMFLGNTADKLARLDQRPLLVVRKEPLQPYRNILVPVDFSEDSRLAARLAVKLEPQAVFNFLHVYQVWFEGHMRYANVSEETVRSYRVRAREQARVQLNQFIDDLHVEDAHAVRSLVHGSAGHAVLEFAEKTQPDLIVMGKHGRSRFEELLVGSVTRNLLDQTESDMLIVRAPNAGRALPPLE